MSDTTTDGRPGRLTRATAEAQARARTRVTRVRSAALMFILSGYYLIFMGSGNTPGVAPRPLLGWILAAAGGLLLAFPGLAAKRDGQFME